MPSSDSDQTINLPQLVIILVLGGLAIRWFFFSSTPGSAAGNHNARIGNGGLAGSNLRAREADVERIQQMFPQVERRSIMWDLQRNGGNVVATTERVLSGRGLEVPPQSFQPPLPPPSASAATPASNKPLQPDLITRYNLKAKILEENTTAAETAADTPKQGAQQAWSTNKGERQALLQRRREEMILAARRKMEAKVAAESALGNGA